MKKLFFFIIIMALVLSKDTRELYLTLNPELRREIDSAMVSMAKQVDNVVDGLQLETLNYIESRAGISAGRVLTQLTTLQKDTGGMFDNAIRAMTKAVQDKTFRVSEDVFFSGLGRDTGFDLHTDTLMWQAMFNRTCPDCLGLHGIIRTRASWNVLGGPNERSTICTIRGSCHCILVPASSMPSTKEMRKPIKIQAARVRKAEKIRGKRYAPSTRKGFLGQINNPKSSVKDLRKIKKVKPGKKF